MISLPGQRATTGPAERGGARGATLQGTAPGTGLGGRGSLSRVPWPHYQAPQGWAPGPVGQCLGKRPHPGARPWEGDPRRWHSSPFRSGQPGASGRKGPGRGRGLTGSPASAAPPLLWTPPRARPGAEGAGFSVSRPPVSPVPGPIPELP